jgi:glycosyltransferase involved in cell wall biosynthesis
VLPKFTQRQVRAYKGVDLRKRRFYSIGRWEPRKNQHGLLRAFCAAFHPDDDVSLTLKWHGFWRDYAPFEVVISQLEEQFPIWRGRTRERITTHPSHLPADQILRLHFENNIYLAPSCGEAWCLPAFEAKVAGNRLIHTPYGGTRDFAGDADFDLPFELEAVPASYGWPEGSQWARPDHDALVAALRAAQVPERFERSADFEARFNLQAVGRRMRTRLQELTGAPWL